MSPQVTRHNHYVPEWYQRGFLNTGESRLHYLDMIPEQKVLSDGRTVTMNSLGKRSPRGCFQEYDLYSTRFGTVINDEVEKFLFGSIDTRGARGVRALASGDPSETHHAFQDFFEFMDAQKLRTPKGLDWIKARYGTLDQTQLMVEMQGLRFMHCAMWTEGVREIVSADDSDVKFIVSDHPVTLYNASVSPCWRRSRSAYRRRCWAGDVGGAAWLACGWGILSRPSAVRLATCSWPSRTLCAARARGALRASWTATARDAWAGAGRDDGMAALIEQQDDGLALG